MRIVKCPWCHNDNVLLRSTCPHCGEEIPKTEEIESPADGAAEEQDAPPVDLLTAVPDSWKGVVLAAIVALLLGGGGKVTFDHWPRDVLAGESPAAGPTVAVEPQPSDAGTESSPTEESATAQVEAIDSLLGFVRTSHRKLPGTLGGCGSVASDIGPLKDVTEERRQQAEQAVNLQVDAVPDGESLKQALVEMTSTSLEADERYVAWAERAESSITCTDASKDGSVTTANKAASAAKRRFVQLWDSLPQRYGQSTYKAGDL